LNPFSIVTSVELAPFAGQRAGMFRF
jgi:hypothetical protein